MTRVVARCPNCGVERDDAAIGPCDVCGTTLRYWCRLHGAEVGWLDSPECPACAAELTARRPPPPAPAPPERAPTRRPHVERAPEPPRRPRVERVPERTRRPRVDRVPAPMPPYAGRPAGEVLRESAEELRPYAEAGAGMAWRLVRALFAVLRYAIAGAVVGALVGGGIAYNQQGDLVWPVISGAIIGGGIGAVIGFIVAIRILFAESPRRIR